MPSHPGPVARMFVDLRLAWRSLVSQPHVTLVALLSVGLGLGANLVLFGVLWGFYVQERDVPAADRLLWIAFVEPDGDGTAVVPPPRDFVSHLATGASWDGVGAWDGKLVSTGMGDRSSHATWVRLTTPGFHALQGLTPAAGRFFDAADTVPGTVPVALLGHARSVAVFGSPADALNREVHIDGRSHIVVGVLPEAWDAGEFPLHVPLGSTLDPEAAARARTVVRLRPGVSRERARAEIETLAARWREATGSAPAGLRIGGEKEVLVEGMVAAREAAPPLILVVTVLLAAAANLATVLLSRGLARRRQIAVRRLLGASRWALVRPLLIESAMIASAAGALGMAVAWLAFRAGFVYLPGPDAPHLSVPLLLYGSGLLSVVVLLGGCWPAVVSGRADASEALRSGGGAVTGHGRGTGRTMRFALALQVAVAVPVVLVAGSLAFRALAEQRDFVGFDPTGLLHVDLPSTRELDSGALVQRTDAEASLEEVAATTIMPVTDPQDVEVDGGGHRLSRTSPPRSLRLVQMTADPIGLLGIPLLAGRSITADEARTQAPVAVVSRTAALRLFGAEAAKLPSLAAALGRQVRIGGSDGTPWLTVVGIVGDVRDQPLFQDEAPPSVWSFLPLPDAAPTRIWARHQERTKTAAVRSLAAAIEAVTARDAPPVEVTTEWVHRRTAGRRVSAGYTAAGAALSILLCLLGLHGLTTLRIVHLGRELGVRSALGAGVPSLVRTVLGGILVPVAVGAGAGLGAWVVAIRLLEGPHSATQGVMGAGAGFLVLIVLLAGAALKPALSAAAVEPSAALRQQ